MREDFATRLVCPACRGSLHLEVGQMRHNDILEGDLRCSACGGSYGVRQSVPRLVSGDSAALEVQHSFGSQWRRRAEGRFENETLWGLTSDEELRLFLDSLGLRPEDLRNRWVLDAGCGSGRLTRSLASIAGEVVGLDLAPTIDLAARQGTARSNLHFVQGNLLHIPFADNTYDIVWSSGVIHHTGDAARAFANLVRVVRPGGQLYVWVYSSRKLSLYKYIRDALRVAHRIPSDALFYLCYVLAPPIKLYHAGKLTLRRIRNLPVTPRERQEGRIRTIAFELHDDLSPRYQTRHTSQEILAWFQEAGFKNLVVTGEVGVRGVKGEHLGARSLSSSSSVLRPRPDRPR